MGTQLKTEQKKSSVKGGMSREHQVQERRQSLLDAAVTVIAKRGLTGITINTIASEAKCSYGVVAFHFKSKDGIIFAALDYIADEYETFLKRSSQLDLSPAERIRKMIESDFDGKVTNAKKIAVWVAFWAEAARVAKFRRRCAQLKEHYNEMTQEDVAALAADRGINIDTRQVASSLNAMVDGFWIANLVLSDAGPEGREAAKEACLAYMRTLFPKDF